MWNIIFFDRIFHIKPFNSHISFQCRHIILMWLESFSLFIFQLEKQPTLGSIDTSDFSVSLIAMTNQTKAMNGRIYSLQISHSFSSWWKNLILKQRMFCPYSQYEPQICAFLKWMKINNNQLRIKSLSEEIQIPLWKIVITTTSCDKG